MPSHSHRASSHDDDANQNLSDESSFYGDEEETSRLEELAEIYDPEPYWSNVHPHLLSTIQKDLLAEIKREVKSETKSATMPCIKQETPSTLPVEMEIDSPPDAFAPRKNRRGPDESASDFVSRLPPSTTNTDAAGPWIYVSNPYEPTTQPDIATLVGQGTNALREYENEKAELEAQHDKSGAKTRAGLARKLNPLQRSLEQGIFALARETGAVSGKWMLFPTADRVDRYWEAVAEATIRGELGLGAKVATDDGNGRARLIAVYTRDFEDREDVKRVLEKLVELELVKGDERPIYYKCDAYTYLEIMGNNAYGLKASLFSSRDVLAEKKK